MPKRLSEYTLRDWIKLRPILHSIKSQRYRLIDRAYCRLKPADDAYDSLIANCARRQVLVTIAFNDAELIRIQSQLVRRFIPQALHLIADNSSDSSAAQTIRTDCLKRQVPYVRLPRNPWQGLAAASRSHGQAMNWVLRQILTPGRPASFGYIDHDLFPTRPCDPFAQLESLPFYGDKRWAGDRWFLWAGYCFFRFEQAERTRLDFSQDWFIGLDTGGANWAKLYSQWDPSRLPDRPIRETSILPGVETRQAYVEWRDDWLHEVGLAGDASFKAQKRAAVLRLLEDRVPLSKAG